LTLTQKEKQHLENLKSEGGIVWTRISDYYERGMAVPGIKLEKWEKLLKKARAHTGLSSQ
jgi:hypothetical protein